MNIKTVIEGMNAHDFANGETEVEVVTNTGAIKQIQKVTFSVMTGAIQIVVK